MQSATVVAQVFSASRMRIKLIARIMAEGMRNIFSLLHAAIALLDAHLKALADVQNMQHAQERHHLDVAFEQISDDRKSAPEAISKAESDEIWARAIA